VEGEDVDDDRSEQRESQNAVAVDQQERAGENLNAGNQIDIVP
jgi:acetyl-CoA acetyltransferase